MADQISSAALTLQNSRDQLADAVTNRLLARHPELMTRYGAESRGRWREDTSSHLSYLREAVAVGDENLFVQYVAWAKVLISSAGLSEADLKENLLILKEVLDERLTPAQKQPVLDYVETGVERLSELPSTLESFIRADNPLFELATKYLEHLRNRRLGQAEQLIEEALEEGVRLQDIYLSVFQTVQFEIGRLWQLNELSVAEEHYCTAATQLIMSRLYPRVFGEEPKDRTMVAVCVGEELHEIGVRMLSDFFEMEGWNSLYLGANTPAPAVVGFIKKHKAQLLAVSATMTFHLPRVKEMVAAVRSEPETRDVKIMVGGYPFRENAGLWKRVGADGSAADAAEAVRVADELVTNAHSDR